MDLFEWGEYRTRKNKYMRDNRDKYTAAAKKYRHTSEPDHVRALRVARSVAYTARKRVELRAAIYEKHGTRCARCGFSDRRALQIDHVFGGGNKERKAASGQTLSSRLGFLKKVLLDTEGSFQILCANCNWIKRYEGNEVPMHYPPVGGD